MASLNNPTKKRNTGSNLPDERINPKQKRKFDQTRIKKFLFGSNEMGFINKLIVYVLLITFGFVFLYPILNMLSYSFMPAENLVNPLVDWIPTEFYFGNYTRAMQVMNYWPALIQTIYVSLIPSTLQAISTSLIGYGFAKFKFPGKNILFVLMIATFIIPSQVTTIPTFLTYRQWGILDSILAYAIPAFFGQGLNSAIFILIFWSFFRMVPKSLEEAAAVDGASSTRIFFSIAVPQAMPGYIISFLFSFVWYWNETYLANLYFGDQIRTLPMRLQQFVEAFNRLFREAGPQGQTSNEAIEMAATFLIIIPLLILYFMFQRKLVESISRTGITGE